MASYDSDKIAHIHQALHSHLPAEPVLRVKALESLLVRWTSGWNNMPKRSARSTAPR